jgi:ATP-dependent DNA ligase
MTEPMLAKLAGRLPRPDECPGGCRYEPKWDGFRAIARVGQTGRASLVSRRSKPMEAAFPEIVEAAARTLPAGTTVDGEIVRWSSEGRLDFGALQRRLHAGRAATRLAGSEPCHYVVFDLLEMGGGDVRGRPLADRRRALEQLLAGVPGTSALTLGPQTGDLAQAREWFDSLAPVGIEGLIVKAAGQAYRPGARDWLKIKHYATTEVIIGGFTGTPARPESLIVGRYRSATGELMVVARSSVLSDSAAAEVVPAVRPATGGHPWPDLLPPGWTSSIYGRREPTPYTRVAPDVVVEARVDVATDGHRWRHPVRYLRLRPDLTVDQVPRDLDLEG